MHSDKQFGGDDLDGGSSVIEDTAGAGTTPGAAEGKSSPKTKTLKSGKGKEKAKIDHRASAKRIRTLF